MYKIGIDLGGTNIAAAVVNGEHKILGRSKIKTNLPRPQEDVLADLLEAARLAVQDAGISMDDIEYVGVGSPGTVNTKTGVVEYANNLAFRQADIAGAVKAGLGTLCYVGNDANAAALGELVAGCGCGVDNFLALTLGTGLGGGAIVNGTMLTGFNYAGAELGHMMIIAGGEHCTCGLDGCIEAYASATALIRQTKRAMEADKASAMWALCGGDIEKAGGRTAFDAMRAGDKTATEVVGRYIEYLALGIVNFINIFQPEILCIGGGVSNEKPQYLLEPLRERVAKSTYGGGTVACTKIVTATLGNDAGIIGAAALGDFS